MQLTLENVVDINEKRRECVPLVDTLQMAGINHRTAPLNLREKMAVPKECASSVLRHLAEKLRIEELVILSTCNRTEFYWVSEQEIDPVKFFNALPSVDPETVRKLAASIYSAQGKAVAEHLFEVASGLDSLVLGETQIYSQVKSSYEQSRAEGFTGSGLNFLFQKTFEAVKRVHTYTGLASQKASIPSVAIEFAKAIFEDLADVFVLVIGTGEIAKITLQALHKRGAHKVAFVTRSLSRAESWQSAHQDAEVTTMENIASVLWKADIVVACTSSEEPVITAGQVEHALQIRKRPNRPILILDLGLPRNVAPEAGRLEQVYLRNIDDLQMVLNKNKAQLDHEISNARQILKNEIDDYLKFCRSATAASTIREIRSQAREIANQELDRTLAKLSNLSDQDKKQVEVMVHRLLGKILHNPSERLRYVSRDGQSQSAIELARILFGIDPLSGLPESPKSDSKPSSK